MREHFVVAADCIALLLVVAALALVAYRRNLSGVLLGISGVALLAGMISMRAMPTPTRVEMSSTIVGLQSTVEKQEAVARRHEELNGKLKDDLRDAQEAFVKFRNQAKVDALNAERSFETRQFDLLMKVLLQGGSKYYLIEHYQDGDWLEGLSGRFYIVQLRDAESGNLFIFPRGQNRISQKEVKVLASYKKFVSTIVENIPAGWTQALFVRGGADSKEFSTSEPMGADFGAVRFRHQDRSSKRYGPPGDALPFPAKLDNNHLPLLRAAYFRRLIAGDGGEEAIGLLDHAPSDIDAESERVVEIILYIKPI